MAKRINQERCIQCGLCMTECPNDGISELDGVYSIESAMCTECYGFYRSSHCVELCPVAAIESDTAHEEEEDLLVGRSADLHPDRFPRS